VQLPIGGAVSTPWKLPMALRCELCLARSSTHRPPKQNPIAAIAVRSTAGSALRISTTPKSLSRRASRSRSIAFIASAPASMPSRATWRLTSRPKMSAATAR
jgi:hypothetical protein